MVRSGSRARVAPTKGRGLDVEEIRLVADLRIMHSKVDELYQVINVLQQRHFEQDIVTYADRRVLGEDIRKADEIYLWFVKLKEETERVRKVVNDR